MALFNDKLIQKVTALIHDQQQILHNALGQSPMLADTTDVEAPSPLQSDLRLLIQVANGAYARTHATGADVQRIELALQHLLALLLGNPLQYPVTIPDDFWQTEIGILVSRVRWWISADELITISNAAALAFGENTQANRMRITRAMDKGQLAWIPDPSIMNPQQNKRVLRPQVEQLRDQRQLPE
ncbi:MAG: hypothetical protein NT075_25535 [Chloroflexi bacterium]|nr:hypothetical protein [Chloroflexota bacterium]